MSERDSDDVSSPEVARLAAKRRFKIRMEGEDDGEIIYTAAKEGRDDGDLPEMPRGGSLRR